jgi:hypothetical protein
MDGVYSVFRKDRWIYYQGLSKQNEKNAEKDMLSGTFSQNGAMAENDPRVTIGLTPEEAAFSLPKVAIRIGEGPRPMGRVASGHSTTHTIGTVFVGAGAIALVWYLTRPEKREEAS